MSAHGYTAQQIESAIDAALQAHDDEAVVSLLHLLALVDPDHAQIIMNAILLANELTTA